MLQAIITNPDLYASMIFEAPNLDNLSYNANNQAISGNLSFYITEEAQDKYGYDFTYFVSNGEHSSSEYEEQFGFIIEWNDN